MGTVTFLNSVATYVLNSSDANGIKDGPNPTSLVESGSGTVIIIGTNSFSGPVIINSGTMQLGNGGLISGLELGTGVQISDNGTIAFDGNNNLVFGPYISGTGSVVQKGSGTVVLSTTNSYSGGTTITGGGAVSAATINDSGQCSLGGNGPVNLNNGTLIYTGSGESTTRQFNGTSGSTNTIDVPGGATLDLGGRVTASAAWVINKVDTGTLSLSGTGDNSFLGVNVNAGTLILNKNGGTGHAVGNPLNVAAGATVQMSGGGYTSEIYNNATAPVTINSGGVFDANGQNEVFNTLNLSGTGIGGAGALINSLASTVSSLAVTVNLVGNTTVGGAGSLTLSGTVAGGGVLTYAGSGTLSLQGTNTYTGGTFVTSGTLDGSSINSIPGNVTLSGSAILELDNSSAMLPVATLTLPGSPVASSVNLNFNGTQNIGVLIVGSTALPAGIYGASATNPNNIFTGPGLLNVSEPFWDANGSDAATGTNVNGGGSGNWNNTTSDWWIGGNVDTTWMTNNTAFFGGTAGTVTVNANVAAGGLFFLTPGYVITNTDGVSTLSLSGNNPIISIPGGTTTVGCNITGGGSAVGLTASGPGTLILTGTNTYSGGTLIESNANLVVNTISDSGTSAIGAPGNLVLADGALTFTGPTPGNTARLVSSPAGTTNTIDVAPGTTLELDGSVNGTTTSPINKTDSGTLILGGSTDNSSLDMNIKAGEVIITKSSATNVHGLGGGASSIASGAMLQLSGSGNFDLFNTCALTIASGGLLDLNSQSDSMGVLTMSGAGAGNGVLINSSTNATSFLTNGSTGVVLVGPTTIGGPGNISMVSTISGTGPITYAGTGTLAMGGNNTYSGGVIINPGGSVTLTNSANSGGPGTVVDNGTLNVAITGNNVVLNNPITGPGVVNLVETLADNLQLGGNMSSFTGTINCPTGPGSNAKAQILTTNVALTSAATINLAAGGTLYVADPGVVIPASLNIFGLGNNEAYGALRLESNAVISGPVTLYGNTTMGNGHAGAVVGTISGPIGQTNGSFGITFTAEPGTIVLTGTNSFTGPITISMTGAGQVLVSGSGMLGAGNFPGNITNNAALNYASTASQMLSGVISGTGTLIQSGAGLLTLAQTNTFTGNILITNGSTLAMSGVGSLGSAGVNNNYAGSISNYGTFNYAGSAPQTLAGVILGSGALKETGPGELTLSAVNSYTGSTTVGSNATLALASSGSINNTAALNLAAGATFDVSAFGLSYSLGGGTTLQAGGKGTTVGSSAATIVGSPGGTVNVGPLVLGYTPQSFSGDATHPSLYCSAGSLNLSGSSLTVSNAAPTPLGAGTYSLVQVASQNLNVASTNVTVTGTGLAAGASASLALSGGSLNLVVASTGVSTPVINSVTVSGNNLVFSGTNGPAGHNYVVLTSTNLALPLNQWTPVVTNNFSGTGTFTVTNGMGLNQQFFSIQVP